MDLKANPDKNSSGSVLEAYLDKGEVMYQQCLFRMVHLK